MRLRYGSKAIIVTSLCLSLGLSGVPFNLQAQEANSHVSWNDTPRPQFPINSNLPKSTPDNQLSPKLRQDQLLQIVAAQKAYQIGNPGEATAIMLNLARSTESPQYAREALRFAIAAKDIVLAFTAVQLWLDLDPDNKDANQAEISLGEFSASVNDFAPLLREQVNKSQNKEAIIAQVKRITTVFRNKQRALEVLQYALQDVKNLSEAQEAFSDAYLAVQKRDAALSAAKAARAADPSSAEAFLQYFKIVYFTTLDKEPLHQEARAFIAANPSEANPVRFYLARLLFQRKAVSEAQQLLLDITKSDSNYADAWYLLGLIDYEFENLSSARTYLETAAKVAKPKAKSNTFNQTPTPTKALALLADIAMQENRYNDALALYNKLRQERTEYEFSSLLKIANILASQGKTTDAVKLLNGLFAMNDEQKDTILITKAQILQNAHQTDAAIKLLNDRLAYDKLNPTLRYFLATLYEDASRYDEMETELRKVMAIQPNDAKAYNLLGYSMSERGVRLNEAKDLIVKANQLSPSSPWYTDSLAWVYYKMGNYDSASKYSRRAYSLSNEPIIAVHLGEILWAKGDQQEAKNIWLALKKVTPKNTTLHEALTRLGVSL